MRKYEPVSWFSFFFKKWTPHLKILFWLCCCALWGIGLALPFLNLRKTFSQKHCICSILGPSSSSGFIFEASLGNTFGLFFLNSVKQSASKHYEYNTFAKTFFFQTQNASSRPTPPGSIAPKPPSPQDPIFSTQRGFGGQQNNEFQNVRRAFSLKKNKIVKNCQKLFSIQKSKKIENRYLFVRKYGPISWFSFFFKNWAPNLKILHQYGPGKESTLQWFLHSVPSKMNNFDKFVGPTIINKTKKNVCGSRNTHLSISLRELILHILKNEKALCL